MKKLFILFLAIALSACVSVPSTLDADGNVDPELVQAAEDARQLNSTLTWLTILGVGVGLVIAASSDDGDAGEQCHFVIGPGGSTRVCN